MIANTQNIKYSVMNRKWCVINPLWWLFVGWLFIAAVLCGHSVAEAAAEVENNQGQVIRVGLYQDPPSLWMDDQGEVKGFCRPAQSCR